MIKIIKTKTNQCTCYQCKTELEYTHSDTQEGKRYDYTGDCDVIRFVKCPVCSYEIVVSRS